MFTMPSLAGFYIVRIKSIESFKVQRATRAGSHKLAALFDA